MPTRLFVKPRLTSQFARFIIAESHGTIWTGAGWDLDRNKALLFADELEAARACQTIIREASQGKIVQHFSVPLKFEVLSEAGVDLAVLKEWLMKAIKLHLLSGKEPNGSVVLAGIWWDEMKSE